MKELSEEMIWNRIEEVLEGMSSPESTFLDSYLQEVPVGKVAKIFNKDEAALLTLQKLGMVKLFDKLVEGLEDSHRAKIRTLFDDDDKGIKEIYQRRRRNRWGVTGIDPNTLMKRVFDVESELYEHTRRRNDQLGEREDEPMKPRSLSVYIDPGDASEELLTELFIALASVYRAYGGSGLKIARDERRTLVEEEVAV